VLNIINTGGRHKTGSSPKNYIYKLNGNPKMTNKIFFIITSLLLLSSTQSFGVDYYEFSTPAPRSETDYYNFDWWETATYEDVKKELAMGMDVNGKDADHTPLLVSAITLAADDIVELLIESGADVNEPDEQGLTPLMEASVKGKTAIVNLLIKKGADVNAEDENGVTALSFSTMYSSFDVMQLLLRHGAKVNHTDHDGNTALMYALKYGVLNYRPVIDLLISAGTDLKIVNKDGMNAEDMAKKYNKTDVLDLLK